MQKRILEYLRANSGPLTTEEEIMAWWKGLQSLADSLDGLTLAIEELEHMGLIAKEELVKDLFVYRIISI